MNLSTAFVSDFFSAKAQRTVQVPPARTGPVGLGVEGRAVGFVDAGQPMTMCLQMTRALASPISDSFTRG